MLECKICGCETVEEKYCCNGWECDCRAGIVNESEDYFCKDCEEKLEFAYMITNIAKDNSENLKSIDFEEQLFAWMKENKHLFKD